MADAPALWRIEVTAPADAVAAVEAALEPQCIAVSSFVDEARGRWRIEGIAGAEPDARALAAGLAEAFAGRDPAPAATVERLAPRDWVGDNLAGFPPHAVGRFHIRGSHITSPPPAGAVALRLDAGRAFGSGEHASTRGCLIAVDRLGRRRRFRRPLDLGCGSGILAIAIAKAWRVPVVAADIDPEAVRVARENARTNGVAATVRFGCGPGYRVPAVAAGAPYDLIVANILARPLARLAGELARHLAPGGVAVLAGLLDGDANGVIAAHRPFGLSLERRLVVDGWATLVLGR
jgi:ribosomal protein L11 methyltransferase